MKKRNKFDRNAVASSRGSYVRRAHFLFIQECLKNRGIDASLEDIIEISITVKVKSDKPRYGFKCFGKIVIIPEEMAKHFSPELIIKL